MSNSFSIPRPVSEQLPSAADLERDKVFLEDFHNGFLSRGVPTATLTAVRKQRHALMNAVHTLLLDFVQECFKRNNSNNLKHQNELVASSSASTATTTTMASKNNKMMTMMIPQQSQRIEFASSSPSNSNDSPPTSSAPADDGDGGEEELELGHALVMPSDEFKKPILALNSDSSSVSASSSPLLSSCCWADVRPYGSVAIGTDLIDSDIDLYFLHLPGQKNKERCQKSRRFRENNS
jgi:hypothetical protein